MCPVARGEPESSDHEPLKAAAKPGIGIAIAIGHREFRPIAAPDFDSEADSDGDVGLRPREPYIPREKPFRNIRSKEFAMNSWCAPGGIYLSQVYIAPCRKRVVQATRCLGSVLMGYGESGIVGEGNSGPL